MTVQGTLFEAIPFAGRKAYFFVDKPDPLTLNKLENMIARKYLFGGRVQGVGFRYATKQIAKGFDVIGTVKNLDDGRVELQIMGSPGEVEAFIDEMHNSPLDHHILEKEEFEIAPLEGVQGFNIIT